MNGCWSLAHTLVEVRAGASCLTYKDVYAFTLTILSKTYKVL